MLLDVVLVELVRLKEQAVPVNNLLTEFLNFLLVTIKQCLTLHAFLLHRNSFALKPVKVLKHYESVNICQCFVLILVFQSCRPCRFVMLPRNRFLNALRSLELIKLQRRLKLGESVVYGWLVCRWGSRAQWP